MREYLGKVEKKILGMLEERKGLLFSVIDPIDYKSLEDAIDTAKCVEEGGADAILVGGSTGVQGEILDNITKRIKESTSLPTILFPGNIGTLTEYADAVYFMSMLNARSPYWISGAQTLAATVLHRYNVEPLPTAYIVIEPGGTVGWVGDANLIPRNRPKLAAAVALAAQYMGFRFVITDAGSAPDDGHIPLEMIKAVKSAIDIPYIVAGGIKTPSEAKKVISSGADIIQVGTAFENGKCSVDKVKKMVNAVRERAKNKK